MNKSLIEEFRDVKWSDNLRPVSKEIEAEVLEAFLLNMVVALGEGEQEL